MWRCGEKARRDAMRIHSSAEDCARGARVGSRGKGPPGRPGKGWRGPSGGREGKSGASVPDSDSTVRVASESGRWGRWGRPGPRGRGAGVPGTVMLSWLTSWRVEEVKSHHSSSLHSHKCHQHAYKEMQRHGRRRGTYNPAFMRTKPSTSRLAAHSHRRCARP